MRRFGRHLWKRVVSRPKAISLRPLQLAQPLLLILSIMRRTPLSALFGDLELLLSTIKWPRPRGPVWRLLSLRRSAGEVQMTP